MSMKGYGAWDGLVTLDMDKSHGPDVVWDLDRLPLPFEDNSFDEIHAYEVLEHIGDQGDWRTFFNQFSEFWRILKPGGHFMATVPGYDSPWAWGDPGHRRIITRGSLVFLSQDEYSKQVGKSSMTDYRFCYSADFKHICSSMENGITAFILEAVKRGNPRR